MLTNVLFGQMRSGAADPASINSNASPQRQNVNRSFSDHMDDRARRDAAKSSSEKDQSNQPDKTASRKDSEEGSRPDRSNKNAVETAKSAQSSGTQPLDMDATESALAGETLTEVETDAGSGVAVPDEAVADLMAGDTGETGNDLAEVNADSEGDATVAAEIETVEPADDETAVAPLLGAAADTVFASQTAKSGGDSKVVDQVQKNPTSAGSALPNAAQESTAAGVVDEVPSDVVTVTSEDMAEGAVDRVMNSTLAAKTTMADTAAQPAKSPTESVSQAAIIRDAAVANGAASSQAGTPGQDVGADSLASSKVVASSADAAANTIRPQNSAFRGNETQGGAAALPLAQAAQTTDAGQTDSVDADTSIETPVSESGTKPKTPGEAAALIAGQVQPRATGTTEPGRRAEGRARESRDAQAVVTGNTSASTAPKPSAAAAMQVSAVQQAFAAQMLAGDAAGAGGKGAEAQLLSSDLTPDMPGLSQLLTEAVMQPGTVHRPETPRLVAVQLAQAFVAKGERNVDVALNPEELGRVKMRVTTSETGITVVIQTERAETGDLMRRHINELADEFRKMGFENVSFEFNGGGASGGQTSSEGDSQSGGGRSAGRDLDDLEMAERAENQVQHLRLGNAGVDMRV